MGMQAMHRLYSNFEAEYLGVLDVLLSQPVRGDRTGTGTHSMFGIQLRFDLQECFPLLTTKRVPFKKIYHELRWMLNGDTNIKYLLDNNVSIWTDWPYKNYSQMHDRAVSLEQAVAAKLSQEAFENQIRKDENFAERWGDCGPVYGYQWRKWNGYDPRNTEMDQIADVLNALRKTPESRRMIVSAWNVADIPAMIPSGLPPCHMMMQFYTRPLTLQEMVDNAAELEGTVREDISKADEETVRNIIASKGHPQRYLDCQVYIRSNDWFIGAPFNMAQYALLTHLMAHTVNMLPGELIYTVGDTHLYLNHVEQAKEQLSRQTSGSYAKLSVKGPQKSDPKDYEFEDLELSNYYPQGVIKAPIAV